MEKIKKHYKEKKHDFFWPSYADLMTSLFFIMLVLFVLTVMMLKAEQKNLIQQKEEAEQDDDDVKDEAGYNSPRYRE